MNKYLYNGIPLLDINTVWTDKTTYPYAIIFVDENDREVLHISPVPFIYEDPNVNISSGSGSPKYLYDSSGWVEDGTGSGYTGSGVKWTNYDIIDISDNSVYLAASEPVPDNGDFNLKSWLIGFALGLAGKPLPFAKNEPVSEPVAYLYGTPSESGNIGLRVGDTVIYYDGAVLPDIDTVYTDEVKAQCPYAFLVYYPDENLYRLYISSRAGYVYGRFSFSIVNVSFAESELGGHSDYDGETMTWGDVWTNDKAIQNAPASRVFWVNEAVYYKDDFYDATLAGTLYMAASDPIPVGEIVDYNGEIPIYEVIT